MAQRITRKQMKRNDLVETVGRTVGYVSQHRRGMTEALLAAAGVAVVIGGFFLVRSLRERRAGQELSAGLAALAAPLASDVSAAAAPKTYPTAALRERDAEGHLRKASSFGSTTAGRAAAVVLAARAEKPGERADVFARAARQGAPEVAAAAEINAARLLASQGKTAEAIDRLKRAIDSSETRAPKDALLFTLAQVLERSGARTDARAAYQRILTDYPASPYRSDARQAIGPTS
jgi:tetratricopeptide (TPR) repeat protein